MKVENDQLERVSPRQHASSEAFLLQLIDYAGLFPPARLPLDAAIRKYAAYQADKDAWMLGRFILPASRLDELDPYVSFFSTEVPLRIAVVGSRHDHASGCMEGLQKDLASITRFRERHGSLIEIDVFELPLPSVQNGRDLLHRIALETSRHNVYTFCEGTAPLTTEWTHHTTALLEAIALHNETGDTELGFKMRMGGVTAAAFPTCEQVAAVLVGCRDRGIAMKYTAGLHHPIRMHRTEVQTRMHGFMNVFTAGMLAYAYDLDEQMIVRILADEAPENFSFTAEGLAWRDLTISTPDIVRLRRTAFRSYGSCSFDEPREDVRVLHIL